MHWNVWKQFNGRYLRAFCSNLDRISSCLSLSSSSSPSFGSSSGRKSAPCQRSKSLASRSSCFLSSAAVAVWSIPASKTLLPNAQRCHISCSSSVDWGVRADSGTSDWIVDDSILKSMLSSNTLSCSIDCCAALSMDCLIPWYSRELAWLSDFKWFGTLPLLIHPLPFCSCAARHMVHQAFWPSLEISMTQNRSL